MGTRRQSHRFVTIHAYRCVRRSFFFFCEIKGYGKFIFDYFFLTLHREGTLRHQLYEMVWMAIFRCEMPCTRKHFFSQIRHNKANRKILVQPIVPFFAKLLFFNQTSKYLANFKERCFTFWGMKLCLWQCSMQYLFSEGNYI